MVRKHQLYILLSLAMLLASCEYNVENEDIPVDGVCNTEVSYNTAIRPLINANCMPCHNGDGTEPFAPDLTTFNAVEGLADLVKEVTQTRRMPIGGSLTDAEINAIACWVDNAAPNN